MNIVKSSGVEKHRASLIRSRKSIFDPSDSSPDMTALQTVYHKLTFQELADHFETSLTNGLTEEQAKILLAKNGPNLLKRPETHYFRKIMTYLFGGFCWLLWVGVIICFLAWKPIGNPPDPTNLGLAILLIFVIFLQAAFEAFQDWSSSKVMNSIKKMMAADATVIRGGVEVKIPASEIVVGDLILLTYGSKVPADLRIIESSDLKFDRSMLTGESEAVEGAINSTDEDYNESKNIAFMATMITTGTGKAIVTLTGSNTMIGSIAKLTSEAKEESTTLQKEINNFVLLITILALTTVIGFIFVWIDWTNPDFPKFIPISSMLVDAIAILVAFIPTGLPVSVTLSLLLVARKMAKNNVLVKNLTVVETLSCVNVIASDKTGTLTQNKMYVTNAAAGLTDLNNLDLNSVKSGLQLIKTCILCNEAKFDESDMDKPVNERNSSGGATDVAILKYGANILEVHDVEDEYTILNGIPFNSKNKWMARILKFNPERKNQQVADCFDLGDDECVITMKGAPDILLKQCNSIINDDGSQSPLDEAASERLKVIQHDWCLMGQRVLIICKKTEKIQNVSFDKSSELEDYLKEQNDLCVLGVVGIIDKPRDGMDEVIKQCRKAGVRVFMVTGDFHVTAAAIASQINIFSSNSYDRFADLKKKRDMCDYDDEESNKRSAVFVPDPQFKSLLLTGNDIDHLKDHDWRIITRYEEIVFARTTPNQKLKVVEEFKRDKNIVAVTGDGVNDSPALKAANIGIAMGGGSEVAMEAAQMVLLDNSFNSMVVAIENGRLVFDNLRKVILYLLPAGSFAEVIPIFLNVVVGIPCPLSPFQMICICVLTDLGPSLAMMLEKSEGRLLDKPPRVIGKDRLVDKKLILFAYFYLGLLETFFANFMFFLYLYIYGGLKPGDVFFAFNNWTDGFHGIPQAQLDNLLYTGQSVSFATLVIIQTFGNVFITRTHTLSLFQSFPTCKAHRNLWIFLAQFTTMSITIIIIHVPFFNEVFKTRPVPIPFYFIPLAFCVVFIAIDEIRKLFVRRGVGFFVKTAW